MPSLNDPSSAVLWIAVLALVAWLSISHYKELYRAAFVEPRKRLPKGPSRRRTARAIRNVTLGLVGLVVADYIIRYLLPPGEPLPSPPWLVLGWLLRDWAVLLATSCVALVVMRIAVLVWRRVRPHVGREYPQDVEHLPWR